MITQGQVRIGTTATTATLALTAALILGGVAGYAARGLALPGNSASSTPVPQTTSAPVPQTGDIGWSPDQTSEDWRTNSPVIEPDRLNSGETRLTE